MIVFAKAIRHFVNTSRVTIAEVAAATGVHETTASRLVHALHSERVVHIAGWLEDTLGRDQTPVFTFGDGADVPRKKLTGAERNRTYRHRQRLAKLTKKGTDHAV
jgi:hypothetical protein